MYSQNGYCIETIVIFLTIAMMFMYQENNCTASQIAIGYWVTHSFPGSNATEFLTLYSSCSTFE